MIKLCLAYVLLVVSLVFPPLLIITGWPLWKFFRREYLGYRYVQDTIKSVAIRTERADEEKRWRQIRSLGS